ncbi:MAG: DUF2934 domain-containing protein [Nitrospiraceae bacterium]
MRQRCVAAKAYELYEARGFQDGHDVEDWLCAEQSFSAVSLVSTCGHAGVASDLM